VPAAAQHVGRVVMSWWCATPLVVFVMNFTTLWDGAFFHA
jgi:hypothetical protein